MRKGRPWSLPLEDRILLVAAYWRTNLPLRQLAPSFGVSKSATTERKKPNITGPGARADRRLAAE